MAEPARPVRPRPVRPRPVPALSADDRDYVDLVRAEAARIGLRGSKLVEVEAALEDLEQAVRLDPVPPASSPRREVRVVKQAEVRLLGWYMRYAGQQLTVIGDSVARLGRALSARSDDLEARVETLSRRVADMERRLAEKR